ncbi:cobalt-precorrin 5A hydrolase [Methanobacterium paludis]|uniref:Cobalamin (Vitamin B12) biosynthesis CbiG protein n=1 Tax=Methanobacterium paludis (strain DSM 25820 / JCM 18151 / SWAN1) TaxID=868131 RepID=F6D6H5_METPW|nr:cobalt-precorrin 5A hydrolase [Methanobacterium paludis]AEG19408.1 cobalamin (vitamin B12) biosynthesis CbiG protein [Methanobacterium paludis]
MKLAIITITPKARKLAEKIMDDVAEDPTVIKVDLFEKNVKKTLKTVFNSYDCIIGIMATGIMVRNICGLIKNKTEDPAVLVVDENGEHVISLLSGHLGGGNDFTLKMADIIGAEPIITTSTDLNSKLGVDSLARRYLLNVDDPNKIKRMNMALINNENVKIGVNPKFDFILTDPEVKESYKEISSASDRIRISCNHINMILRPKKIVAGVGSKKNISKISVMEAVKSAMDTLRLPIKRLDCIATAEMKKDEAGIIDLASELGISLKIIPKKVLKEFKHPDCSKSDFVMEKFGVPGVCEPSALIAAGTNSQLIYKKTAFNGVTVAVAVSKN